MYRDIPAELLGALEPVVIDHGLELVDAALSGSGGGARLRVVLDTPQGDGLVRLASDSDVPVVKLGYTGGDRFQLKGQVDLPVSQISEVWNKGLEAAGG